MDEFYALGEVTITIAGFAALFSILKPQKKTWGDVDKLNLVIIMGRWVLSIQADGPSWVESTQMRERLEAIRLGS